MGGAAGGGRGGEGLGKLARGGGRVRLRRVINGGRDRARADELDHGGALGVRGGLAESASSKHGGEVLLERAIEQILN